jgi:tetratricopeptide (TPR) repeat protein
LYLAGLSCWLILVGSLIGIDQRVAAARTATDQQQIPPLEPPSTLALRLTSVGYTRAATDSVWLATIQYFGGGNPNERYSSLPALIQTVVELDPDFEYPYLFGGLVLPWQGDAPAALALLDAGQARFPQNALLPYYAGAIARLNLQDNQRAAAYFQRAARLPGAPPAAALLAGVSLTEGDDRQVALAWWEGVIASTDNEQIRERATIWRDHLQLVLTLEELVAVTNQSSGQPIKQLSDLVSRGILTKEPVSPLGATLTLNATTGRVELEQ